MCKKCTSSKRRIRFQVGILDALDIKFCEYGLCVVTLFCIVHLGCIKLATFLRPNCLTNLDSEVEGTTHCAYDSLLAFTILGNVDDDVVEVEVTNRTEVFNHMKAQKPRCRESNEARYQ